MGGRETFQIQDLKQTSNAGRIYGSSTSFLGIVYKQIQPNNFNANHQTIPNRRSIAEEGLVQFKI
jgi:hypothetical protein